MAESFSSKPSMKAADLDKAWKRFKNIVSSPLMDPRQADTPAENDTLAGVYN